MAISTPIRIATVAFFVLLWFSCKETATQPITVAKTIKQPVYVVQEFVYEPQTIPSFFSTLLKNHLKDFYSIDSLQFAAFCAERQLMPTDSANIASYFTIQMLHQLFTSQSAANCSKGKILNIPYMWHWVTPNPRHEIMLSVSNELLKNTKPPKEFGKYASYADIDRTPYLYLSELVAPEPKYYSSGCDTFSTFGWCSEREMAFIALVKLLGYEGKVVAEGNHSWSEVVVPFKLNTGSTQHFIAQVDNTFDFLMWKPINKPDLPNWKSKYGELKLAKWYNQKAVDAGELNRINNHVAPAIAMERIEKAIVSYLNTNSSR